MLVRLAFSVMIQVDADVLLIDEVLAVGDAAFQQKCNDEFNRLRDEGRTVLLVTHDMPAVQRFCDRAMLLERGRVVMLDEAERGRRALLRPQLRQGARRAAPPDRATRASPSAAATAARRSSRAGSRTRAARR